LCRGLTAFEPWPTHAALINALVERLRHLRQSLLAWIDACAMSSGPLRQGAFEEADRLATGAVQQWFDAMEPEANRLYQAATDRFVRAANDYIGRVAADAADLDVEELGVEIGFRARRQFYFTHLMHVTGGTPVTWLMDRCAPNGLRRAHVARAASAYLTKRRLTSSSPVPSAARPNTSSSSAIPPSALPLTFAWSACEQWRQTYAKLFGVRSAPVQGRSALSRLFRRVTGSA
jgi:hypothetical protein